MPNEPDKTLYTLVGGESILNDATSVILYSIIRSVAEKTFDLTYKGVVVRFFVLMAG